MSDRLIPFSPEPLVIVPFGDGSFIALSHESIGEKLLTLRLALTRARDRLECHRDPLVAEIDKVLAS